jgi:PTH1 family peptidyl-tRNA hydrolase
MIVGLGNPGPEYEETKHNVGFWLIDSFAERHGISLSGKKGEARVGQGRLAVPSGEIDLVLVKPQTFMNRSGRSVQSLLQSFGVSPSEMIVAYDDLDLPCGRIRIRTKGGSGGHRGVASIIDMIGTDEFIRLRIGIGRDPSQDPADYVLTPFQPEELKQVEESIEKGVEALPFLLEGRIIEAMNRYH